jgi:acyl carrier protein
VLGSAGQSSYAAGNAYLDALAHHRRGLGAAALAVNWGAWSDVGMAARLAARDQARISGKGVDMIAPAQGVALFEELLRDGLTQAVVVPVRWSRLLEGFRKGTEPPMLELLAAESGSAAAAEEQNSNAWRGILDAAIADRPQLVERLVTAEVCRVVGLSASSNLDPDTELSSLGVDSLMTVELKNRLETATTLPVSVADLLQAGTVRQLAHKILELLSSSDGQDGERGLVAAGVTEEGEI